MYFNTLQVLGWFTCFRQYKVGAKWILILLYNIVVLHFIVKMHFGFCTSLFVKCMWYCLLVHGICMSRIIYS